MLDQVLNFAGIIPDFDLNVMAPNQSLFQITTSVLGGLEAVLESAKPDLTIVQGDTTSSMIGAIASFYKKVPVAHLEAGLRSGDNLAPWPEEANRRVVSVMTDLHFAPTVEAAENLLAENIDKDRVFVTGNTVIDALMIISQKLSQLKPEELLFTDKIPELDQDRKLILVTGHRRENFDGGMERICQSLIQLAKRNDVQIVYPVHPNPNVAMPVRKLLGQVDNISLISPLEYHPFVYLMTKSYLVLTDSGGVQEEAPALGKPVLVMRNTTERPEGVTAGTATLVGTDTDKIVREASSLLDDKQRYDKMSKAHNPYGDGKTSQKVAGIIKEFLSNQVKEIG